MREWQLKHKISDEAMVELRTMMTYTMTAPPTLGMSSEAAAQQLLRLKVSAAGGRVWRNNVGAGKMQNGSYIRWGLCNDSPAINHAVKSGDLIGIMPIKITPCHIGHTIGQFMSIEVKKPGWKYTGGPHEAAQLKWIEIIRGLGGDAKFSTGGF